MRDTQFVESHNKPIRILATADLHLGRPAARIPSLDFARQSSEMRWNSIVQRAIREKVDAVALAGDVIEHSNRFFEAVGLFEHGLKQLAEHEIPVYAVAGNHDWDVLPRAVDAVGAKRLHLLGHGGRWESAELSRGGKVVLRFTGWSFPTSHCSINPLVGQPWAPHDGVPTIGILHCDLDQTASRYAPVTRAELMNCPVSVWLLGHVHLPQYIHAAAGPSLLYPGSPQALDPGETGQHGPWIIEISGTSQVTARQLFLSAVRYERVDIDVTGLESLEDVESYAYQTVRDAVQQWENESELLQWLIVRLRFHGRTALGREVEKLSHQLHGEEVRVPYADLRVRIDIVSNDVSANIDLESWKQRKDALGTLANLILQLESGVASPEVSALIDNAHERMESVFSGSTFGLLADEVPSRDSTKGRLLKQARQLMELLRVSEIRS